MGLCSGMMVLSNILKEAYQVVLLVPHLGEAQKEDPLYPFWDWSLKAEERSLLEAGE